MKIINKNVIKRVFWGFLLEDMFFFRRIKERVSLNHILILGVTFVTFYINSI